MNCQSRPPFHDDVAQAVTLADRILVLQDSGLASDIMPVYLSPSEGMSAFMEGVIVAWAIQDPAAAVACGS
ncbi:hypothetical protein [Achromobacter aloeverae]|uniref:hypothetical protein n=1 Tax=Achromobacter aloeverae TaxID=1750518 RepID=UPI00100FDA98|nr:hypothetical protein [Achromobacter aloeverae]